MLSLERAGNNHTPLVVSPYESCSIPGAQLNSKGDSQMKALTTFCCAALALCSAAFAQSNPDHMIVHFNTPVMVGETKLPAGDCDIQLMHGSSDAPILVIRSKGGPSIAAVVSRMNEGDTDAGAKPSLILNHRGNDLQLTQVLFGDSIGYRLTDVE
jgi:hypothetical protein